jgi:hypothetical protein
MAFDKLVTLTLFEYIRQRLIPELIAWIAWAYQPIQYKHGAGRCSVLDAIKEFHSLVRVRKNGRHTEVLMGLVRDPLGVSKQREARSRSNGSTL